jgi:hypothetical protein
MARRKKIKDWWVSAIIWLMVIAMIYIVMVKFKILFH